MRLEETLDKESYEIKYKEILHELEIKQRAR